MDALITLIAIIEEIISLTASEWLSANAMNPK